MTDFLRGDPLRRLVLEPRFSTRDSLGTRTLLALGALFAGLVMAIVKYPAYVPPALTTSFAVLYLLSTIDRNILIFKGIGSPAMISVSDEEALALTDDELPVYTVLLPVYHEPEIVQNLLEGVGKLNYPDDKLEVLLLVDDDQ